MNSQSHVFKGVILGGKRVGKTLLYKHLMRGLEEQLLKSNNAGIRVRQFNVMNTDVRIQFWDWSGIKPSVNVYLNAKIVLGLFRANDPHSVFVLERLLAEGMDHFHSEVYCMIICVKDGSDEVEVDKEEVLDQLQLEQYPKIATVDYLEISRDRFDVEPIWSVMIPKLVDVEKRCGNCFKVFEEVWFKEGYYFCAGCFPKADVEKARAFLRIQY